jgi:hypothetical protein
VYFALNAFTDFGIVTGKYQIDESKINDTNRLMFPDDSEKLHTSYGGGLHVAINQNFVIAINRGFTTDKRDGEKGLYINLNWLF